MNWRIPVPRLCLLSLVVALGMPTFLPAAEQTSATKPNVLFIAVDDLRDWVGYLGKNPQTITPNIDKLATRGLAFTRSYGAAPVCSAARTALMSGLRPWRTGVYENQNDGRTGVPEPMT